MNPIRTYIKAVQKKLPGDRRSLAATELGMLLQAQREALETSLGRKLNEDEMEKLVAQQSPPEQAAERYGAPKGAYDLVERYLMSIQRKLPMNLPPYDILAELREGLTAKIEAKQEASGRPITTDEIATILKGFGSPDIVAYRYRSRQSLIGPDLAPYFWTAQKVAICLVFAFVLLEAVIDGLGTPRPITTVLRAVWRMWDIGVFVFGLVTLAFLLSDGSAHTWRLDKLWNPKFLPETQMREPKSRFESLFSLVFEAMFILWWSGLVSFPNGLPGNPNSAGVHLSDVWAPVHTPILVLAIISAATHASDLVHPGWSRLRSVVSILATLAGVAIIAVLVTSGPLIEIVGRTEAPEEVATSEYWGHLILWANLIFVAVFWTIGMLVEISRLARSVRRSTGSLSPA